jgi:hypothetical protein
MEGSICKVSSTPPCHKGCDRAACGEELDFHAHKKHYTENDYDSSCQTNCLKEKTGQCGLASSNSELAAKTIDPDATKTGTP